jgi:hypothetical protein
MGGELELTAVERINAEHHACEAAVGTALKHAVRCGELLEEQKAGMQHGDWLGWVERNFDGSVRVAQTYMRLWRNREALAGIANTQTSAHLSIEGALKALSAPKSESPDPEAAPLLAEPPSTYEAAEALRGVAETGAERLPGAIATLSGTREEEDVREVLSLAWEIAFREYKLGVGTGEEERRLLALRALDEHVRPVDQLPSRERFALEDELTYREMHTSFSDLIAGGHIIDHTSVAHHIRVMHGLHSEGYTEMAMIYADALINGEDSTVRPQPEDDYEDEGP